MLRSEVQERIWVVGGPDIGVTKERNLEGV